MIIARYLPALRRRPKSGLAIAFGLLAVSFALRYYTPLQLTYVTFYPAIMLATFVGGLWIGAVISLASAYLALYFFVPHTGKFIAEVDLWGFGAFLVVSAIIIFVIDLLAETVTRLSVQSARLRSSEDNTRILMRELTHRMKNQYAVILAMARVTERSTASVPAFLEAFTRRLTCLSRTHDLLVKSEWKGVSIRDLVEVELEPYAMKHTYSAVGPDIDIRDGAVVHLGMALHELATNSAKHGAWLKNEGTVNISWQVTSETLKFQWVERDGPVVKDIATTGFGRVLLEHFVPEAVGGQSSLEFDPHGLRWTFTAPVAGILALKVPALPPAYTAS